MLRTTGRCLSGTLCFLLLPHSTFIFRSGVTKSQSPRASFAAPPLFFVGVFWHCSVSSRRKRVGAILFPRPTTTRLQSHPPPPRSFSFFSHSFLVSPLPFSYLIPNTIAASDGSYVHRSEFQRAKPGCLPQLSRSPQSAVQHQMAHQANLMILKER